MYCSRKRITVTANNYHIPGTVKNRFTKVINNYNKELATYLFLTNHLSTVRRFFLVSNCRQVSFYNT